MCVRVSNPAGAGLWRDCRRDELTLRLIGVQTLAVKKLVERTRIGGLSGIDYDAAADRLVAISDDRSGHGPARFYTVSFNSMENQWARRR